MISIVLGGVRADNHLSALARGCKIAGGATTVRTLSAFVQLYPNSRHRAPNAARLFLRRQCRKATVSCQLDIDRKTIGIATGRLQQLGRGLRNRLEVDVAAKVVDLTQAPGYLDNLLHRVVRSLNDPGGQKQAFNVVTFIKSQNQINQLIYIEACSRHVTGRTIDAVKTVISAKIGEQNLE